MHASNFRLLISLAATSVTRKMLLQRSTAAAVARPLTPYGAATTRAASAICRRPAAVNTSTPQPEPADSAARIVWGLQHTSQVAVHVVQQHQEKLALTQIVPLGLESLHPDTLTNTAFTEFLSKNLGSRTARRQGIVAVVLSSSYLPSQLDIMQDLAGKQAAVTQTLIARDNSTLHVVIHKHLQSDSAAAPLTQKQIVGAVAEALGPCAPLHSSRLQVAAMSERRLQQQLRLWEPSVWSQVLMQQLESRNATTPWLAVRSLMAPHSPDLQAAKQLVARKGLFWLETREDQMQALQAADNSNSSSVAQGASSAGRRTRRGTSPAAAGTASGGDNGSGDSVAESGVVIVISQHELTEQEAAQLPLFVFTDHTVGGSPATTTTSSSSSSNRSSSAAPKADAQRRAWPNIFGL